MALFKSKEQKAVEERMLIKRAIGNIKKYLEKLGESKERYIKEAKRAKQLNITTQYSLAKSGLSMTLSQAKVAEQLLLTMELSLQMKDTANITQQFAQGMTDLSKEVSKINSDLNFKKTGAKMNSALASSQVKTAQMQDFLETSNMAFEGLTANSDIDKELDSMIDREAAIDESELDLKMSQEIDELLKSAKK